MASQQLPKGGVGAGMGKGKGNNGTKGVIDEQLDPFKATLAAADGGPLIDPLEGDGGAGKPPNPDAPANRFENEQNDDEEDGANGEEDDAWMADVLDLGEEDAVLLPARKQATDLAHFAIKKMLHNV